MDKNTKRYKIAHEVATEAIKQAPELVGLAITEPNQLITEWVYNRLEFHGLRGYEMRQRRWWELYYASPKNNLNELVKYTVTSVTGRKVKGFGGVL